MNTTSLCFQLEYVSFVAKEATTMHSSIELIIHKRVPHETQLSKLYSTRPAPSGDEIYEVEVSTRAIEILRRLESSWQREKCICTHEGKDKKRYIAYPLFITDEKDAKQIAYQWLVSTVFYIFTGINPEIVKAGIMFATAKKERLPSISLTDKNKELAAALAADFAVEYMAENHLCTIERT